MNLLFSILLTVVTTFSNGTFHTNYSTPVNASAAECNEVVDEMIRCLQNNPKMLSDKFFVGLGKQKDKSKNEFYLVWKESTYVPSKQYSKIVLDVLVEDKPFLRDVVIESTVKDVTVGNKRTIRVDISYAGNLLKSAYGNFHIEPTGANTSKLSMDVHVTFGWFFRIFISRRVYSNTIDWRLERFVTNMKLMAEGYTPTEAYWSTKKL
jgi:hypothetical protein